jgi:hypothetical protein
MARRRSRTPKEPPVPVTYEESDAVRRVAERIIRLFPGRFGWTTNFRIGYVFERGGRPRADAKLDFAARFIKVPPLWHGLQGFDAVALVKVWFWDGYPALGFTALSAEQQEALIAHVLCHGEMTEKGALRVVPHDLEEFRWVVANYGAWDDKVAAFGQQLAIFETKGPMVRTGTAEQTTLEDDTDLRPKGPVNVDELRGAVERSVVNEPTPITRKRPGQPPAAPLN